MRTLGLCDDLDQERRDKLRAAARFMWKMHNTEGCCEFFHTAECDAMVDVFGFESWDEWRHAVLRQGTFIPVSDAL